MTETPPESASPADGPDPPQEGTNLPALNQEITERLQPYLMPGHEEDAARVVRSLIVRESHSGPLPLGREFARYEQVLPGAANRILAMAEIEQQHRQSLESKVVEREAGMQERGPFFALGALAAMLAVVAFIAYLGHSTEAASLGGVVILGVVALFLGERGYFKSKPNDQKSEE